jgi:hypothetical protein
LSDPKTNEDRLDAFLDRVIEHLPKDIDDPILVVLKGHLLSEEIMHSLMKKKLPHPEYIVSARMTYSQTVSLCQAISDDERHDKWVWNGLKKLNNIRNHYSHSLEPTNIRKKELEFIGYVKTNSRLKPTAGTTELASAVLYLLSGLFAICELME